VGRGHDRERVQQRRSGYQSNGSTRGLGDYYNVGGRQQAPRQEQGFDGSGEPPAAVVSPSTVATPAFTHGRALPRSRPRFIGERVSTVDSPKASGHNCFIWCASGRHVPACDCRHPSSAGGYLAWGGTHDASALRLPAAFPHDTPGRERQPSLLHRRRRGTRGIGDACQGRGQFADRPARAPTGVRPSVVLPKVRHACPHPTTYCHISESIAFGMQGFFHGLDRRCSKATWHQLDHRRP